MSMVEAMVAAVGSLTIWRTGETNDGTGVVGGPTLSVVVVIGDSNTGVAVADVVEVKRYVS